MDVGASSSAVTDAGALTSPVSSDTALLSAADGIPILTFGGLPFLSSDAIVNGVGTAALGTAGTPTILGLPVLRDGTIFGAPGSQGFVIATGPDGSGTVFLDASQLALLSQQTTQATTVCNANGIAGPTQDTTLQSVMAVSNGSNSSSSNSSSVTATTTTTTSNPEASHCIPEDSAVQSVVVSVQKEKPKINKDDDIQPPHGKGPFKCDVCDKEFPKWGQLQRHLKVHADDKPFRCDQCEASFNVESNLRLHLVAFHCTSDPTCPECNKTFARVASLRAHIMMHEKEENLICTECGDEFGTAFQLQKHMKEHREENMGEKTYTCKCCTQKFSKIALLREHRKMHYRLRVSLSHRTYKRNIDRSAFSHKCSTCGKVFQKPSQLLRHNRIHTGERPFKCDMCDKAFNQKGALQIHMAKHSGERPFGCEFCPAVFAQRGNMRSHIRRTHAIAKETAQMLFQCDKCSCVFRKLGSLNAHLSRMHSTEVSVASQNGETTSSENANDKDNSANISSMLEEIAELSKQVNNANAEQATLDCSKISSDILQQALENSGLAGTEKGGEKALNKVEEPVESTLNNEKNLIAADAAPSANKTQTMVMTVADNATGTLKKHIIRKVGGIRWHQCMYCSKEFKKPSDLVRHIRIHTHEKPYKCDQCFRTFNVKSTLTAHQRTHTGIKEFVCEVCDKLFATQGSLKVHLRLHTGARPFSCPHCNKRFRTSGHRKSHVLSHLKENLPKKPRKPPKVPEKNELVLHDFPLQEPILITESGFLQQVPKNSLYSQFLNETSTNERPYKCTFCSRAFKKSSHLKQHLRSHTGEKPYMCDICQKSFVSNGVLKAHSRTHTGVKAYKCDTCNSTFTTNGSLKRHMCIHSESRPYMCPYCQKTFKTAVNCKKHMKTHRHELVLQDGNNSVTVTVIPSTGQGEGDGETVTTVEASSELSGQLLETLNGIADDVGNREANDPSQVASLGQQVLDADALTEQTGLTQENLQQLQQTLSQEVYNTQAGLATTDLENSALNQQILQAHATSLEQGQNNFFAQTFESLTAAGLTHFRLQNDALDVGALASTFVTTSTALGTEPMATTSMANILPQPQDPTIRVEPTEGETAQNESLLSLQDAEPPMEEANNDCNDDEDDDDESLDVIKRQNVCEFCSKSFKKASQLKQHIRSHTGEKPYPCPHCGRSFSAVGMLNSHIRTHSGLREFKCEICNAEFTRGGSLRRHMSTCIQNMMEQKCTQCPMVFNSPEKYRQHLATHCKQLNEDSSGTLGDISDGGGTPDVSGAEDTGELITSNTEIVTIKPVIRKARKIRTNVFKLSDEQAAELAKQKPDLGASISEKILIASAAEKNRVSELKSKEAEMENQPKYHNQCSHCPKSFKKPSDLVRHVRIHTGEKPYQCEVCSKTFTVKSTLDSHLKTHTGEKNFSCHVCNCLFATKGSLKVHMRLHTGAKPFKCPHCDLCFRTSGHRKSHIASHLKYSVRRQKSPQVATETNASIVQNGDSLINETEEVPPAPLNSDLESVLPDVQDTSSAQVEQNADGSIQLQLSSSFIGPAVQITGLDPSLLAQTIQIDANLLQQLQQHGNINITISPTFLTQQLSTGCVTSTAPAIDSSALLQNGELNPTSADSVSVNPNVVIHSLSNLNVPLNIDNPIISAEQNEDQIITSSELANLAVGQDNPNDSNNIGNDENGVEDSSRPSSRTDVASFMNDGELVKRHALEFDADGISSAFAEHNVAVSDSSDFMPNLQLLNVTTNEDGSDKSEKAYTCFVCHKNFKYSHLLNEHMVNHNPDAAKVALHECPCCEKSFAKPSQLERHLRIHTGEKPFQCEDCNRAFNQKNALVHHRMTHSGDRPHKCPYCPQTFTQKGNLGLHLKRRHSSEMITA